MTYNNVVDDLEQAKIELDELRHSSSIIVEPSDYNDRKSLEELRAYSQRLRGVSSNLRRVSSVLRTLDQERACDSIPA